MELKEGYIKIKDLSVWFGMQPESFSKSSMVTKQKKYNILSGYADFHFEGKKLYIDKVYISEYSSALSIAEAEFEKNWGLVINNKTHKANWQLEEKVDTCTRVAKQIWYKHKELQKQVKLNTFTSYCNRLKVDWYGHNYLNDHGTKGHSERFYVNLEKNQPLTQEELNTIKTCKREAYGSLSEQIANIDEAYAMGEINKKERDTLVGSINTDEYYLNYLELLWDKLGYEPEKMTKLFPEYNWE